MSFEILVVSRGNIKAFISMEVRLRNLTVKKQISPIAEMTT